MKLNDIYLPISKELIKVEKTMIDEVSAGSEFIISICNQAFKSPGKRLRPALTLFSAKASRAEIDQEAIDVAAAVELIHTATLVQDDVIDKAAIRRGEKTVGTVFGGDISILFGDYLFSKAFNLLARHRKSELLYLLSEVTNTMAAGEMEQLFFANKAVTEERYFEMIKNKTAILFSASCEMGGIIGGADKKTVKSLAGFGMNFGMAFQIIDDCLDKISNEKIVKKTTGLDVKSGKKTLPDIYNSTSKAKDKAKEYMALGLDCLSSVLSKQKRTPFVEISDYALSYI